MTLQGLRSLLESFQAGLAQEELESRPGPRLPPSPELDGECSDLFTRDALAVTAPTAGARRWQVFISAGMERRARADGRRSLVALLRSPGAGAEDRGRLREVCDQARELARGRPAPVTDDRGLAILAGRIGERLPPVATGAPPGADETVLPGHGQAALWSRLRQEPGFLRRGDGHVSAGPAAAAGCVACSVPGRIQLHWREAAGVAPLVEMLAAAGEALAWAHLPAEAEAEDRLLAADGGAAIYGRLWARAALRAGWWQALGFAGSAATGLAGTARRQHLGRLGDLADRVRDGRPAPPGPGWCWLDELPAAGADAVAWLAGLPSAAAALAMERGAALLEHALSRRWSASWTWDRRAADLLRQLWSEAWARTVAELLSSLDEVDADGELLLADLAPVR